MCTCPRCGRSFANRNQSHACGQLDLDRHWPSGTPRWWPSSGAWRAGRGENGPVTVLAERTRIAFQVRMSFAAFTLRKHWVAGTWSGPGGRSTRGSVGSRPSRPQHLHQFRWTAWQVDDEVASWLAEAYRVCEQRHRRP